MSHNGNRISHTRSNVEHYRPIPKTGCRCYRQNQTKISLMFSLWPLWSMKGGGLECYVTIHNPAVKCQVGHNIFLPDL